MNNRKRILGGAFLITLLCACDQPTPSLNGSNASNSPTASVSDSFSVSETVTINTGITESVTSKVSESTGLSSGSVSTNTSTGGVSTNTSISTGNVSTNTSTEGVSTNTSISTGNTSTNTSTGGTFDGEPQDTYTGTYYNTVGESLRGDALKAALSTVTSAGFISRSYNDLWDIYPHSDVSNGKMILFYTATPLSYTAGSASSKSNKEHVWPQSWYGAGSSVHSNGSPGADAHNVYPCDTQLNNVRSNSAYDELPTSSPKVYERGSSGTYGEGGGGNLNYATSGDNDSYNYTNTGKTIFYPKKGYRGITARVLMYVATRYYNDSKYPVELVDVPQTSAVTGQYGRIGKLSTLLKWHLEEPVSDFEISRNESIYTRWHNNRNPFVDKPKYACRIFGEINENTRTACEGYTEPTSSVTPLDALIGERIVKGRRMSLLEMIYISENDEFLEI